MKDSTKALVVTIKKKYHLMMMGLTSILENGSFDKHLDAYWQLQKNTRK